MNIESKCSTILETIPGLAPNPEHARRVELALEHITNETGRAVVATNVDDIFREFIARPVAEAEKAEGQEMVTRLMSMFTNPDAGEMSEADFNNLYAEYCANPAFLETLRVALNGQVFNWRGQFKAEKLMIVDCKIDDLNQGYPLVPVIPVPRRGDKTMEREKIPLIKALQGMN